MQAGFAGTALKKCSKERENWIVPLALLLAAAALYLPAITWGLPQAIPGRLYSWGPDEIAPMGPLHVAHAILAGGKELPTKYPLFHYLLVAFFYAPYLLYRLSRGELVNPTPGFPYGFTDPVAAIHDLALIGRSVSLVMAAGTVVVAYFTGRILWGRAAGVLAGLFVLFMYPMFYYAKMSNVDVPALFWTSVTLLLVAGVLREGWTTRRAILMGGSAALAIATKDQSYAVLFPVAAALLPFYARAIQKQEEKSWWSHWAAPVAGLTVSAAVYSLASGLVIRPHTYGAHLEFIRGARPTQLPDFWYYQHTYDLSGLGATIREALNQLASSLGWPLFAAAIAGIAVCSLIDREKLLFLIPVPTLIGGVLFPSGFTTIRYVLPLAYILALFAAFAIGSGVVSRKVALRGAAWLVILAGCGGGLLRGADLMYLMRNDPRYTASAWLDKHAQPGDYVEIYENVTGQLSGRINKMPWLPKGVVHRDAAPTLLPGSRPLDGRFVLIVGPEDQDLHWFCPASAYRALLDGSAGYELGARLQTRSVFSHPDLDHHINPRVEIFVRRDRMERFGLKPRPVLKSPH